MKKKLNRLKELTSGLNFRVISATVVLLLVFGIIQGLIGYLQFTDSLTREYNDSAFRTAETAAVMVDGNRIRQYLSSSGTSVGYDLMKRRLDVLCQKQGVTLIYVIEVEQTDYSYFRTVVSLANENSDYEPWEIGHRWNTTNEEYRQIYRDIYENGLERGTVLRVDQLRGYEPHVTSLVPVKNDNGEVTAILCVQRPMEELARGRLHFLTQVTLATLLLIVVSVTTYSFFIRKEFTAPMKKVTDEAERFARENSQARPEELTDISSIHEINVLAQSLRQMESDTISFIKDLTRMTAAQERIGAELELARNIQVSALPNVFPPFPDRREFDIYATMTPAKEVGGDFYDFFLIDENHLALLIADVSGKGVPASLFMMIAKLLLKLRASAHPGVNPSEILYDVNNTLCEGNEAELFVTVWLAILDLSTGNGIAANAGHEHPMIYRNGEGFSMIEYSHDPPLATVEELPFQDHQFQLSPGDELFVYTDGVTEAENLEKEQFGETRLVEALNRAESREPEALLMHIRRELDQFVGEAEPFDDVTMMAMAYHGPVKKEEV